MKDESVPFIGQETEKLYDFISHIVNE